MPSTPARSTPTRLISGALIATIAGGGYFWYQTRILHDEKTALQGERASRERELADALAREAQLTEALNALTSERDTLSGTLTAEQSKNASFEKQISTITGTVGKLDKLAKTDPELLQKYSKVYFLNEHYTPPQLALLDKVYAYDETREFYLATAVMPFFKKMVAAAQEDGIDLWVNSAYRSFEVQSGLKAQYRTTYGTGANTFSADQGYSEHQLGTTIDFTTNGLQGGLDGFDKTPAYTWLTDNAHRYGFVLSYPKGNAYYIFEPWHWRFVGTDLARDLHEDKKHFYDLDQRTLDTYLISIFD